MISEELYWKPGTSGVRARNPGCGVAADHGRGAADGRRGGAMHNKVNNNT